MKKAFIYLLSFIVLAGIFSFDAQAQRAIHRVYDDQWNGELAEIIEPNAYVGFILGRQYVHSKDDESWDVPITDIYMRSSDPSVIYTCSYIETDGNGDVHLIQYLYVIKSGTTTLSYAERWNGITYHRSLTLTVQKGFLPAEFQQNGECVEALSIDYGKTFDNQPVARFYLEEFDETGDCQSLTFIKNDNITTGITYMSSNPEVAKVDPTTGYVTIVKPGQTTISARWEGNDSWNAAVAAYVLNVNGDGKETPKVHFEKSEYTDTLGVYNMAVKAITEPVGLPLRYSVDNNEIASIDANTGAITPFNVGMTVVRASFAGNDKYNSASGSCHLYVEASSEPIVKTDPVFAYNSNYASYKIGDKTFTVPILNNPNNLPYVLSTSNAAVARLTEKLEFEIVGTGETTITAAFPGNARFNPVSTSFTLVVSPAIVPVPDNSETTIDFTKIHPDGSEEVFFSTSATDTYNSETGQLEISTSLTDEQVEDALENVIPGSSTWVEMLPGSLVFDLPAGEGEILIQCMTMPEYTLHIKMEGKEVVRITQESLGWAKVNYNLNAPTHVVIYLHANASTMMPAHITTTQNEDGTIVGAYIQAIKITPKNANGLIEITPSDSLPYNRKILHNNVLYIKHNNKIYTTTGVEVR